MSEREYSKISPAVWRSARFLRLGCEGRVLHLYLMTNEHVNSPGCYRLPDLYACADLGWEQDEYLSHRAILQAAGLIDFDEESSFVFIEGWMKHNPPTNDKHSLGMLRRIQEIDSDRLREKALAAFQAVDGVRLEKQEEAKAKAAERAARIGTSGTLSHLMNTRIMGGGR